jgi:OmpA-OmpF porin, OOP family
MKKIPALILFVVSSISMNAQTKIAIKGGYNFATAKVEYQNGTTQTFIKQPSSFVSGYGLGFLFDIPFDGKLHFMPTISFNSKGYKYNPTFGDTTRVETAINYIDITPSLSFNLKVGKKSDFVLFAGPEISFAMSGKEKDTKDGITTSKKIVISTASDYSRFDLGVTAGIGFHTRKFLIESLFQLGLANINNNFSINDSPTSSNYMVNIKNRMFSINVGYFLK